MSSRAARLIKARSLTRGAAVVALCGTTMLGGCNNAGEGVFSGAALGAGSGAAIGAIAGGGYGAGIGAAIGAVAGALGGGIIGDQNQRNAHYGGRY